MKNGVTNVIIAIGSSPADIEAGCLGTLLKFIDRGFHVYVIIAAKRSQSVKSFEDMCKKAGVSGMISAEKFVHSSVTQENVQMLRSIIEPLSPALVIFPSPVVSGGRDDNVLGRSSILACRGVGNMLMYDDSTTSTDFVPKIYSVIDKNPVQGKKIPGHKLFSSKVVKMQKKYGKYAGLHKTHAEAFDTNRILLFDNDGIFL